MRKIFLFFVTMLLSLTLMFTSCGGVGDEKKTDDFDKYKELRLYDLLEAVTRDALPPLKIYEGEPGGLYPPGDFCPLDYLYRAPQELVGQKLSLSLELMKMHDSALLFQYVAETGRLIVLGNNSHNTQPVLLVLQTEYDTMQEFLTETDCWRGTVTKIMIVDGNVWMYSENGVRTFYENVRYANEDSRVCYGVITADERLYFDEQQPKDNYAAGFHRAMKHLGVE